MACPGCQASGEGHFLSDERGAKLRVEFSFGVKDTNLQDKKFYKNLYNRVSSDYIVLSAVNISA